MPIYRVGAGGALTHLHLLRVGAIGVGTTPSAFVRLHAVSVRGYGKPPTARLYGASVMGIGDVGSPPPEPDPGAVRLHEVAVKGFLKPPTGRLYNTIVHAVPA